MQCFEIDLGQLLKVTRLDRSVFVPPQEHCTRYTNEYILYIVTDGMLCLQLNDASLTLMPGDVYLFERGVFQKPLRSTDCEFYFLHFVTDGMTSVTVSEEEYCQSILKRRAAFFKADIYSETCYDYIHALVCQKMHIEDKKDLERIVTLCKNNTVTYGRNVPEWRVSVSAAAASIFMLLEDISFTALTKGYSTKNGSVYDNVKRIVHYVEKHFTEDFDSTDIERALLINFDYANRIFKKHIGESIIRYRNHLRINTAKTMLDGKLGGVTMDAVAEAVGFSDRYYFSRYFKKLVGISPEEYRAFARKRQSEGEEDTVI